MVDLSELSARNRFRPRERGRVIPQSITMYLGSSAFTGWEDITISKSIQSLAHSFSFTIPQKYRDPSQEVPVPLGTLVTFYVNDERVLTGRIEKTDVTLGPTDRSVKVSGRSLPADLVDCTVEGPKEYKKIRLDQLGRELSRPFGVRVFVSVVPGIVPKIGIRSGDTVFQTLDKAARMQGFFWISTRGGNIRLTRAGRLPSDSSIVEGVNLKQAKMSLDNTERFRSYTVLAQQQGEQNYPGVISSRAKGTAADGGVDRYRPLTIQAEGGADTSKAIKRAQWEASSRLAKAVKITVTMQGWVQETGVIWGLNQLVPLRSPSLGIDGKFLATTVEQTHGSDGSLTTMTLTHPDAFLTKPVVEKSRGSGLGGFWERIVGQ